jgi:hypothetical protein
MRRLRVLQEAGVIDLAALPIPKRGAANEQGRILNLSGRPGGAQGQETAGMLRETSVRSCPSQGSFACKKTFARNVSSSIGSV